MTQHNQTSRSGDPNSSGTISKVEAREVLDSRGRPTVEVDIWTAGGEFGRAIAPSGASTGQAEALELRDGDSSRYDGLGVRQAVANVRERIAPELCGLDVGDQLAVDSLLLSLDGSPKKSSLGANATLAVSLAAAHAGAAVRKLPLYEHFRRVACTVAERKNSTWRPESTMPLPMTNMISGGLHAGGNIDFQDFLIMPIGAADYSTALEWTVRIYNRLGERLTAAGYEGRLVGDEGGFGPRLKSNAHAAEMVVGAIGDAGLEPGNEVTIALDVAASHFYEDGTYRLAAEQGKVLTSSQMIDKLEQLVNDFPITSIEDGLAEEDWAGWQELIGRLGDRISLVGDDLLTTNCERIQQAIDQQAANAVLIKMNQIGTITETLEAMALARDNDMRCVVSARSGETEDSSIADLAVGTAADLIKIGSIVRSERLAKYNQLLRIEQSLA